jgi:hypothetical protein
MAWASHPFLGFAFFPELRKDPGQLCDSERSSGYKEVMRFTGYSSSCCGMTIFHPSELVQNGVCDNDHRESKRLFYLKDCISRATIQLLPSSAKTASLANTSFCLWILSSRPLISSSCSSTSLCISAKPPRSANAFLILLLRNCAATAASL